MKKILLLMIFIFVSSFASAQPSGGTPNPIIEESDGSPSGRFNKLIVSNGSLTITGKTASYDTDGVFDAKYFKLDGSNSDDTTGDFEFFKNLTVADNADGKSLYLYRVSTTEGTSTIQAYTDQFAQSALKFNTTGASAGTLARIFNNGPLNLNDTAGGDIRCFNVTDVADAADGKAFYVYRMATEGDSYLRFYIDKDLQAHIINTAIGASNYFFIESNSSTIMDIPSLYVDLGDNAGSNKLYVRDSDGATVASIDSNGKLSLLETGATPSKYTYLQGGDQVADITYTLPTAVGAAGTFLKDAAGDGVLSWAAGAGESTSVADTATLDMTLTGAEVKGDVILLKDLVTTAPLTGGTNDILVGADADITLALDFTAAWDFGGATSLEVPNGADPTTNVAGEIAVDSSVAPGSGIRFYGDAAYTVAGTYSKSFVILNPVATDDYPVWCTPYAITIKHVRVQCLGGTNIIGQLTECDAEGINPAVVDDSDITATANNSVDDDGTLSNPSIDALDYIGWATTSISGTPTSVTVTFDYIINQVN